MSTAAPVVDLALLTSRLMLARASMGCLNRILQGGERWLEVSRMTMKKRAPESKRAKRSISRREAKAANADPVFSPGASFPVVGVGASAGGLEALSGLLKARPARRGMAVVGVQHLAPEHESALTQLLFKATAMPVVEVS